MLVPMQSGTGYAMSKRRKIAEILSKVTLFLFIAFSIGAISKLYGTYKVNKVNDGLRRHKPLSTIEANENDEWDHPLLLENEDYVGWLTVYGTNADGPVVQGKDNAEYLRTDFYHNKSEAGTLFMDEEVDVKEKDGNRIIYGHMMNDGTMFGTFKKYKDAAFFKENNIVRWEDRYGEHYYRLFAAVLCSGSVANTNYLNIQQWAHHLDEEQTQEMLKTLQDRAFLFQKKPTRGEGKYIFLVTCEYSQTAGKLVLVGEEVKYAANSPA